MTTLDKLCVSSDCQTASRLNTATTSPPSSSQSDRKTQRSFSSNFLARAVLDARVYKTEYRRNFGDTPRSTRSHCNCSIETVKANARRPSSTPKPAIATPYKRGIVEDFICRDIQINRSRIATASAGRSRRRSRERDNGACASQHPRIHTASLISSLHRASSSAALSEVSSCGGADIDITKVKTDDELESGSEHYPRQAKPMILNLENLMQSTPEVIELELERMDMAELERLDMRLAKGMGS